MNLNTQGWLNNRTSLTLKAQPLLHLHWNGGKSWMKEAKKKRVKQRENKTEEEGHKAPRSAEWLKMGLKQHALESLGWKDGEGGEKSMRCN